MFDNLREQANASPFYEEEAKFQEAAAVGNAPPPRPPDSRLLGMTPQQRFILAALLMVTVCILGTMCLLITGKIGLF